MPVLREALRKVDIAARVLGSTDPKQLQRSEIAVAAVDLAAAAASAAA